MILITGAHKAFALYKAIEEGVNHMWTVSAFQQHPQTVFVCDEDATLELRVKTVKYFQGEVRSPMDTCSYTIPLKFISYVFLWLLWIAWGSCIMSLCCSDSHNIDRNNNGGGECRFFSVNGIPNRKNQQYLGLGGKYQYGTVLWYFLSQYCIYTQWPVWR